MKTLRPSSPGFSITPTEEIRIRPSRYGRLCRGLYLAVLLTAALLIYRDGYAIAALPALGMALWLGVPQRRSPLALRWASGQWQLQLPGNGWAAVEIVPPVHSPSWLLAFRWRPVAIAVGSPAGTTTRATWLYLWPDSLAPDQWRRLRKGLRLQG